MESLVSPYSKCVTPKPFNLSLPNHYIITYFRICICAAATLYIVNASFAPFDVSILHILIMSLGTAPTVPCQLWFLSHSKRKKGGKKDYSPVSWSQYFDTQQSIAINSSVSNEMIVTIATVTVVIVIIAMVILP